jgi:hypothetical protein
MVQLREVIVTGARAALRHWRLVLPLYLVGLLLGLAQTWPLLAAGIALGNPILGDLAAGGVAPLVELWLANPAIAQTVALWIVAALLLTLLYGLAYNFFSGGFLAVFAADGDVSEQAAPFWGGCRRWFWSFTGLGMLLVVFGLLAAVVGAALGGLLGGYGGAAGALAALQIVNVLGELARALGVARDQRNPFVLLGMAMSFARRNLAGVLALALLGLLIHAGLTGLYVVVARAIGESPVLVVWQQAAVMGWLWVKLLRLAWAIGYVRLAGSGRQSAPDSHVNPAPAL